MTSLPIDSNRPHSNTRRWVILALLFAASVINFVDRQSLSILARTIQDALKIDDIGYATIVQCFLLAYTLSFLVAGWVTDRLGIRWSMTLFIGWWSISNMLTGLANSMASLATCRFLLGSAESGLYTVAPKVVSEQFPPRQRGLAVGIYTAGATIGATLAPPMVAFLVKRYGWQSAFVFGGALGLIWIVPWLLCYVGPRPRPATPPPSEGRVAGPEAEAPAIETPAVLSYQPHVPIQSGNRWWGPGGILFSPAVLLLLLARIMTDPVWHFILNFFPKYLSDVQHFTLDDQGRVTWVVYLAADVGSIAGGWLSGLLICRGISAPTARKIVMTLAATLVPCSLLVPFVHVAGTIIALVSIMALAHLVWMVTLTTLAVDLIPSDRIGSAFGVIATGSGLGGMLFAGLVGRMITYYSYTPIFLIMGCLHPLALFLIWQARPMRTPEPDAAVVT